MDVAYVAASVVFLLAFPRVLSPLGWWLTLGLAEVVTVFAIAEYVGLRRLHANRGRRRLNRSRPGGKSSAARRTSGSMRPSHMRRYIRKSPAQRPERIRERRGPFFSNAK